MKRINVQQINFLYIKFPIYSKFSQKQSKRKDQLGNLIPRARWPHSEIHLIILLFILLLFLYLWIFWLQSAKVVNESPSNTFNASNYCRFELHPKNFHLVREMLGVFLVYLSMIFVQTAWLQRFIGSLSVIYKPHIYLYNLYHI